MSGRGLSKKTTAMIDVVRSFLEALQPTTVRGVCYQLFTRGLMPNMSVKETKKISGVLKTARERGMIPWAWIVDEGRRVERRSSWSDPGAFMQTVRAAYRKDWWDDQPERVLVISEKGTVGGILRPVLHDYGVGFLVLHGWSSSTAMYDLASLSREDDRPLTLLYVGDHDPSGRYMSDVDIPKRQDRYGGDVKLIRLALTPEQIEFLPTFPAEDKIKDRNYPWFVKTHGEICCELDALDANALRGLVDDAIRSHIDAERWRRAETTEQAELTSLSDFLATWNGLAAS